MGAELRQYDDYPEEDLDFIRELEEEEEEILTGSGARRSYVTRETVPELRALREIDSYQKMHPFETESVWCEKGETPFMFDTPWGPVGISICFDTYQFPELQGPSHTTGTTDETDKAGPDGGGRRST